MEHEMAVAGVAHGVYVTRLRGRTTGDGIERLIDTFETWARSASGQLVTLTVPQEGLPMPGLSVRKAASESMRRTDVVTPYQATVLSGQGFWLSAARSVMTALNTVAGRRDAHIFDTLQAACVWAAEVRGQGELGAARIQAEVLALAAFADGNG